MGRSWAASFDYGFDPISSVRRRFVFPNTYHVPACVGQAVVRVSVAHHIGLNLLAPEGGIRLGPGSVLRAAMPEAAVDEDNHARWAKDDVGAAPPIPEHAMVYAKPQPALVKLPTQRDLGFGVSATNSAHAAPGCLGSRLDTFARWSSESQAALVRDCSSTWPSSDVIVFMWRSASLNICFGTRSELRLMRP